MPDYPGIPTITDKKVLAPAVEAIRECVQLLTGAVGSGNAKALTKKDIEDLVARIERIEAELGI